MVTPYIGEIRIFAGNFAPAGWAFCDGSLVPIAQNPTLFTLIGTLYGGDGVNTFGLPDLRGRLPIHQGQGPGLTQRLIGQQGGEEQHTLGIGEIPLHVHTLVGSSNEPNAANPSNRFPARAPIYGLNANELSNNRIVGNTGGGAQHENMPPFAVINFIIAIDGVFPSPP